MSARAAALVSRMNQILDDAERQGRNYLRSGEKSLYDSLKAQLDTEQRHMERRVMEQEGQLYNLQSQLAETEATIRDYKEFRTFLQGGPGPKGEVISGQGHALLTRELRQQAEGTGSAGGDIVAGWTADLLQTMQAADGLARNATILEGDKRLPVRVPAVDDLANTGYEVAENATVNAGPDAVFSAADFTSKTKFSSGILSSSVEAAQDASIGTVLIGLAGKRMGRRLGIKLAAELVANATATTTSETSVRGKLADMVSQCDYALADTPNVGFAMSPKLLSYLQKKEVAGLITLEAVGDRQFRLLGWPVFVSPFLPSTSDSPSSTEVFFGAMSRLTWVANTVQVAVYRERYAELGQVAWQFFTIGSQPALVKCSATDAPVLSVSLP